MWKVLQIVMTACLLLMILKSDHYDAIRHEFYQIWDCMDEMRKE